MAGGTVAQESFLQINFQGGSIKKTAPRDRSISWSIFISDPHLKIAFSGMDVFAKPSIKELEYKGQFC